MRWVVGLLVLATVLAACGSAEPAPPAPRLGSPATSEESRVRTIAYGDHPDQVADLYLPAPEVGPHPVVVLVHGGFWREQYRRDLMEPLAEDLVARGYAVWNIEYRRVGGAGGWPETFLDAAAAVDELAVVDAPLDLDRVATVGHSAGGHLALWLASRHRIPPGRPGADPGVRPMLAISQAGVADLALGARGRIGSGAVTDLLGGGPDDVPEVYAAADPTALLPTGVRSLAVHGAGDDIVPLAQSRSYVEAASAAGDDAELIVVDGDHFTVITPGTEAWQRIVAELDAVLLVPAGPDVG